VVRVATLPADSPRAIYKVFIYFKQYWYVSSWKGVCIFWNLAKHLLLLLLGSEKRCAVLKKLKIILKQSVKVIFNQNWEINGSSRIQKKLERRLDALLLLYQITDEKNRVDK